MTDFTEGDEEISLWINCGPHPIFQNALIEFAVYCHDQGIEYNLDNLTSQYLNGAVYQGVRMSERSAVIVRMRFDAVTEEGYVALVKADRDNDEVEAEVTLRDRMRWYLRRIMPGFTLGMSYAAGCIAGISWLTDSTYELITMLFAASAVAVTSAPFVWSGVKWSVRKLRGASA